MQGSMVYCKIMPNEPVGSSMKKDPMGSYYPETDEDDDVATMCTDQCVEEGPVSVDAFFSREMRQQLKSMVAQRIDVEETDMAIRPEDECNESTPRTEALVEKKVMEAKKMFLVPAVSCEVDSVTSKMSDSASETADSSNSSSCDTNKSTCRSQQLRSKRRALAAGLTVSMRKFTEKFEMEKQESQRKTEDIQCLQHELANAKEALCAALARIKELELSKRTVAQNNEYDLLQALDQKNAEVAEAKAIIDGLVAELKQAEEEVDISVEREQNYEEAFAEFESKIARQSNDIERLKEELRQKTITHLCKTADQRSEIDELKEQMGKKTESFNRTTAEQNAEIKQLKHQLAQQTAAVKRLSEEQRAETISLKEELRRKSTDFDRRSAAQNAEINVLREELRRRAAAMAGNSMADARYEIVKLKEELEQKTATLNCKVADQRSEIDDLKEQLKHKAAALKSAEDRCKMLERQVSDRRLPALWNRK